MVGDEPARVAAVRAQLTAAKYSLERTTVRAPSDGVVTYLGLRPGARVTPMPMAPVMAFVDTSETLLGASIQQINLRFIEPGQSADVALKYLPGQVIEAEVESVLAATEQGQVFVGGAAAGRRDTSPYPMYVRLKFKDDTLARSLPAGAGGQVAIYTAQGKPTHLIRRVMMHMTAWMNYVVPM
jgi:multidrug resistance efflux pump